MVYYIEPKLFLKRIKIKNIKSIKLKDNIIYIYIYIYIIR